MFTLVVFAKFAAGPDTPTCRDCVDGNCDDNLLPELMQQGLLTTAYYSFFSRKAKPTGNFKCTFISCSTITPQPTYLCEQYLSDHYLCLASTQKRIRWYSSSHQTYQKCVAL